MKNIDKFLNAGADAVKLATLLNEFGTCPRMLDGEAERSCTMDKKFGIGCIAKEDIRKICTACLAGYLNEELPGTISKGAKANEGTN
ncbi:MAG: hypothetical protein RSB39_10030 [Oscillospiraceae bacterium]